MKERQFDAGHDDLIHDISYDFYGKRLATCSSDHRVKVFDLVPVESSGDSAVEAEQFEWKLNDSWKAHDSAVLRVKWAHPEFGQVLVTCSFDRTVRIWEEQLQEAKASEKRWQEKARLVDSRGTVQDVSFASEWQGLKISCVGVDGVLRIYEAMDIVNLAHWTLVEDFDISSPVLSSSDTAGNIGGSGAVLTTGNSGATNQSGNGQLIAGNAVKEKDLEYCLSWCRSRILPPSIVVGCGKLNAARIYTYSDSQRKWICTGHLHGHTDTIHCVAWAPSIGKSYQTIATACKDGKVRIFKLYPNQSGTTANVPVEFQIDCIAELNDHREEVWRVEWNLTGSMLASGGDDGRTLLWQYNYLGEWTQIQSFTKQPLPLR